MDSNTHSIEPPNGLADLAAVVDELAAQDLDRLSDPVRAQRIQGLRVLVDRLEGQWLKELAAVDARGAAGADQDQPAPSTAGWLGNRLRMGAGAARDTVRTARALFRGPLVETADALTSGQISAAHARVLANGTRELSDQVTADAEPVLVEAARRLDPPLLRQAVGYLLAVADPEGADRQAERCHERRGLWLAPTVDHMVAVNGLLEPEAGHILRAALEPLARPAEAEDSRNADQRNADALTELARRQPGGRVAAQGRWGPAPGTGHRRPRQSARPPRSPWWGHGLGRAAGPGGVPAPGLRRGRPPGRGHPPAGRPWRRRRPWPLRWP